jgi:hypothetical protein
MSATKETINMNKLNECKSILKKCRTVGLIFCGGNLVHDYYCDFKYNQCIKKVTIQQNQEKIRF